MVQRFSLQRPACTILAIELTIIERASEASPRLWSSEAITRSAAVGPWPPLLERLAMLEGAAVLGARRRVSKEAQARMTLILANPRPG